LGHSFGGWVVFEMAQQLFAKGREVLSVTMLDTEIPDKEGSRFREYSRVDVLMKLVDIYEQIAGMSLTLKAKDFARLDLCEQLPLLHERLVLAGIIPEKSNPEILERIVYIFESNLRTHYTPKDIFCGDVQLILLKETDKSQQFSEEIALQWKYWAPNLTYKQMEGNHMTILKPPHVNALSEWLKIQIVKYKCSKLR
jgi:thioesterase domain-containing protein